MGAAHSKRCTKIYDPGNILRIFEERNTYSDKPCSRLELQRAQENAPKQRSSRRNNPVQIAIRNDVIIENIYIMGKIRLLLLLVLTIPCIARGQITIRQTAIVEKAVLRPERFDSLENIVPTERDKTYNLKKYLEQEVFFIPVAQPVLQKALEGERLLAAAQKTLDSLCELQQACTDSIRQLTSKGQRINLFRRNDKIAEKSAELQQRSLSLIYPIDQQEQKINRIKYAYPSYSPYRRAQQGGFYRSDSLATPPVRSPTPKSPTDIIPSSTL